MDTESLKQMIDEVLAEFQIDGKQVTVETAAAAPTDAVRISILDASGDTKTVTIDLRGSAGQALTSDDVRHRLKEHLATFKETSLN